MSESEVKPAHWLKPYHFAKGTSGNYSGSRNYHNRRRAVREISTECLERVKEALFDGDIPGLEALSKEPDVTPMEALAITVVMRAMQKGDAQALGMLLDRFIPIVKQPTVAVQVNTGAAAPALADVSDEELARRAAMLEVE